MTDDQLDKVYREYFHREVPAELPPLRRSDVASTAITRRSRFVLAASIAAILGLGLWLSGHVVPTTSKDAVKGSSSKLLQNAEADGTKLLENIEMP